MLLVLSMWPFLPESVTCAVCRATTPPWVTSYINILAPECVTATNYCPFVAHSAVEVAAPSGGTRTSSSGANGNNTVAHLPPTHPHTNIPSLRTTPSRFCPVCTRHVHAVNDIAFVCGQDSTHMSVPFHPHIHSPGAILTSSRRCLVQPQTTLHAPRSTIRMHMRML
jgi:hypothetical protein